MRINVKSKLLMLLVFVLLFSMLACMMSVTVFAHDETGTETDSGTDEQSAFEKWWDSYNQIVGYCVAGVILVAIVIIVYLWIPKKNSDKKSKLKTKKAAK